MYIQSEAYADLMRLSAAFRVKTEKLGGVLSYYSNVHVAENQEVASLSYGVLWLFNQHIFQNLNWELHPLSAQ